MSKVVLKNKYEIETVMLTSLGDVQTTVADVAALQALKDKLTADNLSAVTTVNDAGLEVGKYTDLVLDSTWQISWAESGSINATFGLHEKTELEKLEERVSANEDAVDTLTEAALA